MPFSNSLSMPVALRGVAIASVVLHHAYGNHAHGWIAENLGFYGGMDFLLMLTGYNFARFSLDGAPPPAVRRGLWSLARTMILFSVAMLLLWAPFKGIEKRELLLIANWFPNPGKAMFPIEFAGMLIQICLIFWLMSWLPGFAETWKRPLMTSSVLFAIGVALVTLFPRPDLHNRLPWLYLWAFSLGIMVYFGMRSDVQGPQRWIRPALLLCALVATYAAEGAKMPLYWMTIGLGLFVYVEKLPLPYWPAHLLKMMSQATLAIFFFHWPLIVLGRSLFDRAPVPSFLFSLFGSLLIWAIGKAAVRAWQSERKAQTRATRLDVQPAGQTVAAA